MTRVGPSMWFRALLPFFLASVSLAGCMSSPGSFEVPELTAGTQATYEMWGLPVAPWGGHVSNAQHDGESLLPALGENIRVSIDGPYCTLDHGGKRFCEAYVMRYELERSGEWHFLGEQLATAVSGLLSSHGAIVKGRRTFNETGTIAESTSVVWVDSFRRGSVDAFGALLYSGTAVQGSTWQSPSVRLLPGVPAEPLVAKVAWSGKSAHLDFGHADHVDRSYAVELDAACPFPAAVESKRPDGSYALTAKRVDCTLGAGPALALIPGELALEGINPRLRPVNEVLGANAPGRGFQPGIARLGDILDALEADIPEACPDSHCNVATIKYEPGTRPNHTILGVALGSTPVDRWTLCVLNGSWTQVVIEWSGSQHWTQEVGPCSYLPGTRQWSDARVLDMRGLESDLASFSPSGKLWYELRILLDPGDPSQLLATVGPFNGTASESSVTFMDPPLWWSAAFDGFLTQARWPTRLLEEPT